MWRPRTWAEVNALIGTEETSSLDFKKAIPPKTKNEEIAKDIAAMTVNGGVLLYGVDEDKATAVATEITRVPVAGLEERLRGIAGSRIGPTPDFDVEYVREDEGDAEGVAVVVIPPSPLAPHQLSDGRYPCRRGTTTDSLTEPEIERLYGQRRTLGGAAPTIDELLEVDFVPAPDTHGMPLEGVGRLALVVRPVASDFVHPGGAWQERHLAEAVSAAALRQNTHFAAVNLTRAFIELGAWEPMSVAGWTAGRLKDTSNTLGVSRFAATLTSEPTDASVGRVTGWEGVGIDRRA